jgi:hypothetical protein
MPPLPTVILCVTDVLKEVSDYLLVLFTLALVLVSWLQWKVLCKHEEWMKKHDAHLEKLAQSAKDNADAAKDNAKAAQDSFKSVIDSERAWVVADAPLVPKNISSGQSVKIECAIRNRGNTMARIVEKAENYRIQNPASDLPETPDYGKKSEWSNGLVLAPASESVSTREFQVTNDEFHKVITGSMVLFVFGYAKYWDVFEREHETRYIFRFNPTAERWTFNVEDRAEYTRTT